ncbi:hypothetical protein QQ008_04830 [Fulvivirgaceae bacterium BMA10]|uniref:MORN repeat protein n=1 Tax=Splendidivirga corallicola TaxID=3051826 RepID=A0ABT8KJP3_9BACT|nr:hypothetical protein [Fulvivirgaceae bacterium BMA10]
MKITINISRLALTILSITLIAIHSYGQAPCKVLSESLNQSYAGACKKGLANGEGVAEGVDKYQGQFKKGLPDGYGKYTWANGNVYEGNFKKGLKEGEGILTFNNGERKGTTQKGFWKKNKYIGLFKDPYKVHSRSPLVTNVRIAPAQGNEENVIEVTINSKGKTVNNPQFDIDLVSGNFVRVQPFNLAAKIYGVTFPFRCTLTHSGESTNFEIKQAGSWSITIDMNK